MVRDELAVHLQCRAPFNYDSNFPSLTSPFLSSHDSRTNLSLQFVFIKLSHPNFGEGGRLLGFWLGVVSSNHRDVTIDCNMVVRERSHDSHMTWSVPNYLQLPNISQLQ